MGMPMAEIIGRLDLAPEVRQALLERTGTYALALVLVESYESGEWEAASCAATRLGLPLEALSSLYVEAIGWARDRMSEAAAAAG
jgi:c-di-GMP phosphodiesterase